MFCMWKININYLFIELKQGFGVLKGNGFCGVIRYYIKIILFSFLLIRKLLYYV